MVGQLLMQDNTLHAEGTILGGNFLLYLSISLAYLLILLIILALIFIVVWIMYLSIKHYFTNN